MKDKTHFLLFACCIPVKGAKQSLIYDLGLNVYLEIDNIVYEMLENNKGRSINELKALYNGDYNDGIDKYFQLFIEKNIGFLTSEPDSFPSIKQEWDSPFEIHNAIIEISNNSNYDVIEILNQLSSLGCSDIQLKFLFKPENFFLEKLLKFIKKSRIRAVQIKLPFTEVFKEKDMLALINNFKRISAIIIYSSPEKLDSENKRIFYTKSNTTDKQQFFLSFKSFFEAINFNIGLNKKICVDEFGNIRNYLDHEKKYSNVNEKNILEILNNEGVKKKWQVSNDEIEVCKDCQFRYMCLSTSDLIKDNDKYYKKNMCNYNPISNTYNESQT